MNLRKVIVFSAISAGSVWLATNIVRAASSEPAVDPRDTDRDVARREVPVEGAPEEKLELPEGKFIGGNGVIEPKDRETRVASEASGRVAAILVTEGQKVQAGDVLVKLDDAVQLAALAAAEAELEVVTAELTRALKGNRKEDVEAAFAESAAAKARAELSAGVAERLRQAAAGGGATRDEVERAVRQAEADGASANLADARKQAAIAGTRKEDVGAARARVLAARARRDRERALLEERVIRSPVAGEVLAVKVRVGEFYAPGNDPLVIVGDTTQLRVRVDIDERDLGRLTVGARALVRAPAYPGRDFAGSVIEVGRRMGRKNVRSDDPVERNDAKVLEAVILLERPDGLVVGQRVTAFVTG